MELNAESLATACRDDSDDAGLRITAQLEPLGGLGSPVKPAVYPGGVYQRDKRYVSFEGGPRAVEAIVIDNVPSQANRLEAVLMRDREFFSLPELTLDLSALPLPAHLPTTLSSFQFPHRNADAYLRDAELAGKSFPQTDIGRAIFAASALEPTALFEWMPQALLYGFWQSHLGKKRQQTKLARSWVSEIVGYEPAAVDIKTLGLKGDPVNLSVDEGISYSGDDSLEWSFSGADKKGKKSKDSLAEVGHGQVPVDGTPAGVSFAFIRQTTTASLAGLRRIHCDSRDASAAGRALLLALGVYAHVAAFSAGFSLRSGAELMPREVSWEWLTSSETTAMQPLTLQQATTLLNDTAGLACGAGLPVGPRWPAPLTLLPKQNLAKAIAATWPLGSDQQ